LRLPEAGTAGNLHLWLAACTVGLAITVAVNVYFRWHDANGSSQEESMGAKVRWSIVRGSVLSNIEAIGAAVVGGLLAA